VSGGLFAFVTSWDEMIGAPFLTVRHIQTLPRAIWSSIMGRVDSANAAILTVMVVVMLIGVGVQCLFFARKGRNAPH